jgi:hypothetical protein
MFSLLPFWRNVDLDGSGNCEAESVRIRSLVSTQPQHAYSVCIACTSPSQSHWAQRPGAEISFKRVSSHPLLRNVASGGAEGAECAGARIRQINSCRHSRQSPPRNHAGMPRWCSEGGRDKGGTQRRKPEIGTSSLHYGFSEIMTRMQLVQNLAHDSDQASSAGPDPAKINPR